MSKESTFKGYHRLTADQRCEKLVDAGLLTKAQMQLLREAVHPDLDKLVQQFSENVLGGFVLPFGIVPDVPINNKNYILPLAVEETSIVAGLCKMAKWVRADGQMTTSQTEQSVMGQVYFPHVKDVAAFEKTVLEHKEKLIDDLNAHIVAGMVKRGGGVSDLCLRILESNHVVIDVHMLSCDAMGANLITQVAESLKDAIGGLTGEIGLMGIVSNYSDRSITTAQLEIQNITPELGQAIEVASRFAEMDPHRAATHNKGIMNGIDAILIATGNDWRADEAGCHAYAAKDGHYKALATWRYEDGMLKGELKAPIAVGTVGGVTKVHPQAQLSLQLLQIKSASELAQVVAATGLLQNLAALNALVGVGIAQGHMRLHIDNLLLQCDVEDKDREALKNQCTAFLKEQGRITLSDVKGLSQKHKDSQ
jgi:hydroxymethylglutaryl-CoA reductase